MDTDDLKQTAGRISSDLSVIDAQLNKLRADNKRMISLLSQAALFIACQPENRFRAKWLHEAEELIHG